MSIVVYYMIFAKRDKEYMYIEGLVSVIMPCFNSEKYIANSIISVLEQEYGKWELIICDDNSHDKSLDICKYYSNRDNRIKVICNKYKKGAAGARNSALELSKGQYICFLDSDDLWHKQKLTSQLETLKNEKCFFSFCDYISFSDPNKLNGNPVVATEIVTWKKLMFFCNIGCSTVMIDRSVTGNFEMPYICKEDYGCWLSLLKKFGVAKRTPGALVYYRLNSQGVSSNKFIEIYRQAIVLRKILRLPLIFIPIPLFSYAINGLLKHSFLYKSKEVK